MQGRCEQEPDREPPGGLALTLMLCRHSHVAADAARCHETRYVCRMKRLLVIACLLATIAARPDRRIVDRVTIGDPRSEQEHAAARGKGWVRYALNVFDDTE